MARTHCPECGGELEAVSESRPIVIGQRAPVNVEHAFSRCRTCGHEFLKPSEMKRVRERAAELIREREGLLAPAEITAFRKSYKLSRSSFEELLGVGPKTAIRWEQGKVFPNQATNSLIWILREEPRAMARLAAKHCVPLGGVSEGRTAGTLQIKVSPQSSRNLAGIGLSAWPKTRKPQTTISPTVVARYG